MSTRVNPSDDETEIFKHAMFIASQIAGAKVAQN